MSAPKFTPGPWMVARDGRTIDSDEHWVAETSAPSLATRHADARLIAAAPELYEELTDFHAWAIDQGHHDCEGIPGGCPVENALAKARGE